MSIARPVPTKRGPTASNLVVVSVDGTNVLHDRSITPIIPSDPSDEEEPSIASWKPLLIEDLAATAPSNERWWVGQELPWSTSVWVACCVDPGRRYDVITSIVPSISLAIYGILRLSPEIIALPREGPAPIAAAIAPFVYCSSFLVSILYHVSLPHKLSSAISREFDFAFIMVGLAYTFALLAACVGTSIDGSLSPRVSTNMWIDAPVAAAITIVSFAFERIGTPVELSHTDRNDPSELDHRAIHRNPTAGWDSVRQSIIAILALSWVLLIPSLSNDLRRIPNRGHPPIVVVQMLATAVFFIAAFFDFVNLARHLGSKTPTACSHSTWHLAALVAIFISILNVDLLLLRWQCQGSWPTP